MKLPYTEVILYPEVKSQTSLSSLQVSCKHALSDKIRSSHPEAFCKKGVHSNFAKFKVKHMCQSLLHVRLVCDIYYAHAYLCRYDFTLFCFRKLKLRRLIFLINCRSNLTINIVKRGKKMKNK